MSQTDATWDSAISEAAAPPPTGETEGVAGEVIAPEPTPAEEATEAQSTEEVETPSDPSARAVETPEAEQAAETAEVKEEDDPPEVAALPTPQARKWARARDREARLVDDFLDPDKPVIGVAERLYDRSQSRYAELAYSIFDAHKDDFSQREFGLSVEEVKARLAQPAADGGESQDSQEGYDPLTDPTLPEEVVEKLRRADALEEKYGQLESKVSSIERQEQERAEAARLAEVERIGNDLYESVVRVVPEGIKEYGLEVSERDPPEIKGLKLAAQKILLTEMEPTFNSDPDSLKAVKRAKEFAERLERENAFREEDALKVRVRAALGKVRESDEVKAIFDAIKVLSERKAEKLGARGQQAPQIPATQGTGVMPVGSKAVTWEELTG